MDNGQPPPFHEPIRTIDPAIKSLLKEEKLTIQHGISFSKYLALKPLDNFELIQNSKLLSFYFRDANCYINSRRIFLELEWYATKEDGSPLTIDDETSANNPTAHGLIDSLVINIG